MFHYAKAKWKKKLDQDIVRLANEIGNMREENKDIKTMWKHFKTSLLSSAERYIPSSHHRSSYNLPWVNRKIRKLLRQKKRLYNQAKRTNNWQNFKIHQKECRRHLRRAEWQYINTTIENGLMTRNSKPFWRYVKSRRQDNAGVAP